MIQQTAVEWLVEQLKERGYAGKFPPHLLFEQAKAMEKQQIIAAHGRKTTITDVNRTNLYGIKTGQEYYTETYGSKTES